MTRTRVALLNEADEITHRQSFTREDASRVESLLSMITHLPADGDVRGEQRHDLHSKLPRDPEFMAYLAGGKDALEPERRASVARELRAAQSTTDAGGGYICPADFSARFETILKRADNLFQLATLFETSTGVATIFPVLDDVGSAGTVVAQNAASTNADAVFAGIAFDTCSTWRSGFVSAPVELVSDSAFDFESLLAGAFATRIARGAGAAFTAKLLTSATRGVLAASATVIAADEVFDLIDSVDPDYAANGSFLMKRSTFTALSKLKSAVNGTYLFPQQLDSQGRPLLAGYPVHMSPSLGALTANLKSISFGDHSRFIRRQVKNSLVVRTYPERQAELGRICYEGFLRCDGDLAKGASTSPVKYLQMAGS